MHMYTHQYHAWRELLLVAKFLFSEWAGSCQSPAYIKNLHLRAAPRHSCQSHPYLQHRPSSSHVQRTAREGPSLLPPSLAQRHPSGEHHVCTTSFAPPCLTNFTFFPPDRSVFAILPLVGRRSMSSMSRTCAWLATPSTHGWTRWHRAALTCHQTKSRGMHARPFSLSAFTEDVLTMTLIRYKDMEQAACHTPNKSIVYACNYFCCVFCSD